MSIEPNAPKADRTALYVILGVSGGILLLCLAPAVVIVVCLAAIQLLGTNSSMTFQTVAQSISTTTGPVNLPKAPVEAEECADEFLGLLLKGKYKHAYLCLTPQFEERSSPEALRELWESSPVLREREDLLYVLKPANGGSATNQIFKATWKDRSGREVGMTVEVRRSADVFWDVHRCTIP